MDDGDLRSISRGFFFDDNFRAELWEADPSDRDDHTGSLSLLDDDTETVNEDRSHNIEAYRAEYTIIYRLINPGSVERECFLNLVSCVSG